MYKCIYRELTQQQIFTAMQAIDGENIVQKMRGYFPFQGSIIAIYERMHYSLSDRIRIPPTGLPRMREMVRVCKEVAVKICYVHDKGYIHRDYKEKNIMIQKLWDNTGEVREYIVKICDLW